MPHPWRNRRADHVTPLIAGMNMVARGFVTGQQVARRRRRLVFSEFTGGAVELRIAVLSNPSTWGLPLPDRARARAAHRSAARGDQREGADPHPRHAPDGWQAGSRRSRRAPSTGSGGQPAGRKICPRRIWPRVPLDAYGYARRSPATL
jgi:hypothetical protein